MNALIVWNLLQGLVLVDKSVEIGLEIRISIDFREF
jgi:hypothetical protein